MREACGRCRDCGKRSGKAKHAPKDRGGAFPTVAWKTLRVPTSVHRPLLITIEKEKKKEKDLSGGRRALLVEAVENARQTPAASETKRTGFPRPSDDDGVSHSLQKQQKNYDGKRGIPYSTLAGWK